MYIYTPVKRQFSKLVINSALNFIQNHLHSQSEHLHFMENSIAYSQSLGSNKICYNKRDIKKLPKATEDTIRSYDKTETVSHICKAIAFPRNEILNRNPIENDDKIPLIVAFNRTLSYLRYIINQSGHILQREPKLKEIFQNPAVICKRNKNICDFILGNKLYNNKKLIHAKPLIKGSITLV